MTDIRVSYAGQFDYLHNGNAVNVSVLERPWPIYNNATFNASYMSLLTNAFFKPLDQWNEFNRMHHFQLNNLY